MEPVVVLVGGHGGMSSRYMTEAKKAGVNLKHFENKIPAGLRANIGKISLILIAVTMVSHSLREQVKDLAAEVKIVYLKTPSISSFKEALRNM